MHHVAKPALLRQLLALAAAYPAQILSCNKMLGQLQDAGNTTTLAHYLRLLQTAWMVSGLELYSAGAVRRRGSSPKLILWNNALINALSTHRRPDVQRDGGMWGRLVENAVGAHPLNGLQGPEWSVGYWRDGDREVDYVVASGRTVWAVEVRSGRAGRPGGLEAFRRRYPQSRALLSGSSSPPPGRPAPRPSQRATRGVDLWVVNPRRCPADMHASPKPLQDLLRVLLAAACPLAAAAGLVGPGLEMPGPAAEAASPEPLYAAPTRRDRAGRVLAAVQINGQGPFRFIVDTGANRSAIAPATANELGLLATAPPTLSVQGVTGEAQLPSVDIDTLRAGDILLSHARLPVLAARVFADADGILGNEGLRAARIDVDFVHDRVTVSASSGRRASSDALVVPVRLEHGGLLVARGRMGGLPVHVIVDTGAERTLGNAPLRDALLRRIPASRRAVTEVQGVTPETASGVSFIAPALEFGRVRLSHLPVTFGDLHIFQVWNLAGEPAVIIGMDIIGTLRHFAVDYPRRELQLTTFRGLGPDLRKCGPNECATRIPRPPGD